MSDGKGNGTFIAKITNAIISDDRQKNDYPKLPEIYRYAYVQQQGHKKIPENVCERS